MESWSDLIYFIFLNPNFKPIDDEIKVFMIFWRILLIGEYLVYNHEERLNANVLIYFFER